MATYKIKKGKHSSSPIFPLLTFKKRAIYRWKVKFDSNCEYTVDSQGDINKLVGIGWFPSHHKNSARFGWRYAGEGMMDIFAYIYDEGKRLSSASDEHKIGRIEIGKEYTLQLQIFDGAYVFAIIETSDPPITISKNFRNPGIGYYLKPYFGGNPLAPHDMTINVKRI